MIVRAINYDRRMGYKLLGFVVWQGGKHYFRGSLSGKVIKLALAGIGAAAIAGAVFAGRQATGQDS